MGSVNPPVFGIPSFGIPAFGIPVFGIPDFGIPGGFSLPSNPCLRNPCFRNPCQNFSRIQAPLNQTPLRPPHKEHPLTPLTKKKKLLCESPK